MKTRERNIKISRRKFLKDAGFVTIGFNLIVTGQLDGKNTTTGNQPATREIDPDQINAWLKVHENGSIHVYTGKMELGQGIRIAIAQVGAEELNTEPEMVTVHLAETGVTPDEGYTAGSRSIEQSAMAVRSASAAAAAILMERAAEKLQTDPDVLYLENGKVRVNNSNKEISFAAILAGDQITGKIEGNHGFKPKKDYRWVGKPVFRKDIPDMVTGKQEYVQDLRFPGMVHARIVRPAGYGRKLLSYDEQALKKEIDGILKLVVNGSFMGVITGEEFQAVQAQMYLERNSEWSDPEKLPEGIPLKEFIRSLPAESISVTDTGKTGFTDSSSKASYFRPYTMHGAMGPSCAVARFDGESMSIWTHSQGVYPLRRSLQGLINIPEDKIHIAGIPGAGCYGHNGADDVAADAAMLALAYPGHHVRLQWSRADEHGWEPYGSAMIMDLEAELDETGRIRHWAYDLWSDVHSTRPGGNPSNLLPGWYLEKPFAPPSGGYFGGASRNALPYYTIPNIRITGHRFTGPLRVSALRGLGAYANIFAIECFMDELAEKAKRDPIDFRLDHLADERARAVILKLREITSEEKPGNKEGLGYAFSRYKNEASYMAVAALVSVEDTGKVLIGKMWGVIDSGEVINPDGLKNQTEGGMLQSASWMLKEAVRYDDRQVISLDWYGYPILRYEEVPEIEVTVIDRPDQPPLGAGEAAQGPASAAIANAIRRAGGRRYRDLPLSSQTG
jgi:nicotinate dehydrogenase subunit B